MACCLMAPSHYWTNVDLSSVRSSDILRRAAGISAFNHCNWLEKYSSKISLKSPKPQWVNTTSPRINVLPLVLPFQQALNEDSSTWTDLKEERDPKVLSKLLYDWLDHLKEPVLSPQDVPQMLNHIEEPMVGLARLSKVSGYRPSRCGRYGLEPCHIIRANSAKSQCLQCASNGHIIDLHIAIKVYWCILQHVCLKTIIGTELLWIWTFPHAHTVGKLGQHIDWLVQERCYSSALAMELCLSCTNPSTCMACHLKQIIYTFL